MVFVNGQNLGRYWKIGPQETLYLPGPWLRRGGNEVRDCWDCCVPVGVVRDPCPQEPDTHRTAIML